VSQPRTTRRGAKDAALLHDSDGVQLRHCPGGSDFTLIAFAESTAHADGRRWWPRRLAEAHDLDLLAVVASRVHWYPAEAMAALLPVAAAAAKPRRLAFGFSMGGFAALKYGAAVGAAAAIAFSPQASIDPADAAFDRRSRLHFVPALHRGHRVAAADLPAASLLAYDPLEPTDARHAALLAGLPGVVRAPLAHAGHGSIRVLSESGDAPALFALALEGRMAEAARLVRAARHRSPTIWLALGMRAQLSGKAARAEALLARARELGARPERLAEAEAAAAERLGRREMSLAALRRLHAQQPNAPRLAMRLGGKLMEAGQLEEAEAAFRAARAGDPHYVPIHLGLIAALEAAGKTEAAVRAAAEAVEALPEPPILRLRLGKALLAAGRHAQAAAALREALARNPDLAEAREALAAAERAGRAAAGDAGAGDAAAPPAPAAHRRPGVRPSAAPPAAAGTALQRLRQAVARDPSDEAAHLALIDALLAEGRKAPALAAAQAAVAALPGSGACQARLGTLLLPRRPAEAVGPLHTAIALGHATEQVRLGLAHGLNLLGRKDEALSVARETVAAFPDSMHAQAQLGMLALDADPAEAVPALRAAIALGHGHHGIAHALAHGLRALGDQAGAIAALREAAEREPANLHTRFLLGRLLEEAEDWPAAEEAFRGVLALDEAHADAHLHLSEALRRQKRIKEAVAAFRRGEALGPSQSLLRAQRYRMFGELA
jgi:tetratricopeptide (TPR) repeat protein